MRAITRPKARRIGLSLLVGLFALSTFASVGLARDHRGHNHPRRGKAPRGARAIGKAMKVQANKAAAARAAKAKAAQAKLAKGKAQQAKAQVKNARVAAAAKAAQAKRTAQGEADRAALQAKARQLYAKRPHPQTKGKTIAGTVQKKVKGKSSILNRVLFYVLFAMCVCFALVTITRKSPLMSALSLLVVFLGLAGVYLFLQAPFMAVMQIIVYAGAVVILFVFVIMSIGMNDEHTIAELGTEILYFVCAFVMSAGGAAMYHFGTGAFYIASFVVLELLALGIFLYMRHQWLTRFLGTAALTFALLQVVRLASMTPVLIGKTAGLKAAPGADPTTFAATTGSGFGQARSIGHSVFNENVFAFEALSLLLLAAVVAAVVIVRSRKEKEQTS